MADLNWADVEQLFHEAAALNPSERETLLAAVEPAVREAVEGLLRHAGTGERISRVISQAAAASSRTTGMAGPYKLVKEIGRGGMGAVHLGLRADDVFEKQVAVKFVQRGMDSPVLRRRFEEERRILARLEHPNIARLIDGGATAEGQPYLVMEFVSGQPITQYAAEHHLDLRARVALFLETCDAVQYAHANLVVHRDLKPGNIIVDESGRPRLLDFGIAKLIDDTADSGGTTQVRLLTPDYASPEQIQGGNVSTATDIFSLGAVLYELLAGKKPARAKTGGPAVKPSVRKPEWKRQLTGDLDNIVLKAMRPEPRERYATVTELRDDLRRYLDGRPVIARDYRPWERAAKFVRRHRIGVLATAGVLVSLAVGIVISRQSAVKAERAGALAVAERARAEIATKQAEEQKARAAQQETVAATARGVADTRLDSALEAMQHTLDDLNAIHDLPGNEEQRRAGFEKALASMEGLVREAPDNARALYLRALAVYQLGHVYGHDLTGQENLAHGLDLLKRAQKELKAQLPKHGDPDEKVVACLVSALRDTAFVISEVTKNPDDADSYFAEAERFARQSVKRHPGDIEKARVLAQVLSTRMLTSVQRRPGKISVEAMTAARKEVEALLGQSPGEVVDVNLVANLIAAEANAYRAGGHHAEELDGYRRVVVLREKARTLAPLHTGILRSLKVGYGNTIAALRWTDAKSPENEELAKKALTIAETLSADPQDRAGQWDLATALVQVGSTKYWRGDSAGGADYAQRGLVIMKKLATPEEPSIAWHRTLAGTEYELGNMLESLKRMDEAATSWRECLTEAEATLTRGDRLPVTANYAGKCAVKLGRYLAEQGKAGADGLIERGVVQQEKAAAATSDPAYQFLLAQTLGEAAAGYSKLGQREMARRSAARALEIDAKLPPTEQARWAAADREQTRKLADGEK